MDAAAGRTRIFTAAAFMYFTTSYLLLRLSGHGPALLYSLQSLLLLAVIYLISIGADWMVDASVRLARRLGISYLVIGLTVVAIGTSAPELAASLLAGLQGSGDVSIANIVGSNIFNLCFILGGAALLTRGGIAIKRVMVWRDGAVVVFGSLLLFLFVGGFPTSGHPASESGWLDLLNLKLDRIEGVIFVAGLVGYLYWIYRSRRSHPDELPDSPEDRPAETPDEKPRPVFYDLAIFAGSLAIVLVGCNILVGEWSISLDNGGYGALWFAHQLGLPNYVVGATIVAAGTSAPELVVSLTAASRGHGDIATGNLMGSTIFNIFGVTGAAGLLLQRPLAAPVTLSPEITPTLIGQLILVILICLFMFTGRRLSRREGLVLLAIGVAKWVLDFATRGRL